MRSSLYWLFYHLSPFHRPLMALAASSWLGSSYQLLLPWVIRLILFRPEHMPLASFLCIGLIFLGEINHRFQGAKSIALFTQLKHHTRMSFWNIQKKIGSSNEESHILAQTLEQLPPLVEEVTRILLYQNAHFVMQSTLYIFILFHFCPLLIAAYCFLLLGMWYQSMRSFHLKKHHRFLKKRQKKLQHLQYELLSASLLIHLHQTAHKVHQRLQHASRNITKAETLLQKKQEGLRRQTAALVLCYYAVVVVALAHKEMQAIDFCYLLMMSVHVCSTTQYQAELLAYVRQKLDLLAQSIQQTTEPALPTSDSFSQTLSGLHTFNLSFRYPNGPQTLLNWSYSFRMGRSYAIVGTSGKGKSTVLKLLLGLLTPQHGNIKWLNGEHTHQKTDWNRIAYFPQTPIILSQSLCENITCGLEINKKNMIEAIKNACLDAWVKQLPFGIHTQITPETVSLGLQQRIAWARAFYRNPPVWLMDEPCSALNQEIKNKLHQNLHKKNQSRLIIATTHCMEFAKCFDQVVSINRG